MPPCGCCPGSSCTSARAPPPSWCRWMSSEPGGPCSTFGGARVFGKPAMVLSGQGAVHGGGRPSSEDGSRWPAARLKGSVPRGVMEGSGLLRACCCGAKGPAVCWGLWFSLECVNMSRAGCGARKSKRDVAKWGHSTAPLCPAPLLQGPSCPKTAHAVMS